MLAGNLLNLRGRYSIENRNNLIGRSGVSLARGSGFLGNQVLCAMQRMEPEYLLVLRQAENPTQHTLAVLEHGLA